jgi:hypothetical protein
MVKLCQYTFINNINKTLAYKCDGTNKLSINIIVLNFENLNVRNISFFEMIESRCLVLEATIKRIVCKAITFSHCMVFQFPLMNKCGRH